MTRLRARCGRITCDWAGRSTWVGSRAHLGVLGVVAALMLSGCTADWPMFRGGPERVGSSSDSTLTKTAVRNGSLAERWHASYRSGSPSTSNAEPAVVAGVVYVQSGDGKLHAFDATSGAPRWTVDAGGALAADRKSGSSPAVVGGVVYIGGHDRNVYAFDAGTGVLLWTGLTGAAIESSPAVANGVVYITADDFKLYAFDAAGNTKCATTPTTKTCAPLWTTDPTNMLFDPAQFVFAGSSPTVAHGRVYVAGVTTTPFEAVIDVFDAAGCGAPTCPPVRVLQTFDYEVGGFGTPIVVGGQVLATSSPNSAGGNSHIWAWDEASGARRWWGSPRTYDGHANTSTPSVANGFIYWANGFQGLQAFDLGACATHDFTTYCQPAWTAPTVVTDTYGATASPAVANGVVYAGNLGVVPGRDGLSALDAAPDIGNACYGVVEKECGSIAGVGSEGAASAQIAVANGMIYAAAGDTLHVFGLEQVPPTTSIVSPSNGAVVSGTAASMLADAADNVGIAKVEFHLTGGTLHDALIGAGSAFFGAWISGWDTTAVPNGTYTLNSVATDLAGNTGRSADVTITVQN